MARWFVQWAMSLSGALRMGLGLVLMLIGIRLCWMFTQADMPLGTATVGGLALGLGVTIFVLSVLDDETLDLDV